MQRVLVIGPKDSADRITRVAHALAARRPGVAPLTPPEILAGQDRWADAYQKALEGAVAVVCVPRPDGTIGSGTLLRRLSFASPAASRAASQPSELVDHHGMLVDRSDRAIREARWSRSASTRA